MPDTTSVSATIEVAKAVGPYVTAMTAILGCVLTAWFAHRNWLRQQAIQESQALRQQQAALLREVPEKLVRSGMLIFEQTYRLAIVVAMADLSGKFEVIAAIFKQISDRAHARIKEVSTELAELQPEVIALATTVLVLFGETAAGLMQDVMKTQQTIAADPTHRTSMKEEVVAAIEKLILSSTIKADDLMTWFQNDFQQHALAVTQESSQAVAKLTTEMAAVAGLLQASRRDNSA